MATRANSGDAFGHHTILEPLGAGGMGEVYRARDTRLERDVALKILPAERVADPAARTRLLREARTASQLNHPNICTIHEVGESDGEIFVAMELVSGQTLSERLRAGPLPADLVLRYGVQLADALSHAHQHHVVHRDLKSANVMIAAEGRLKVLDFGLATRQPSNDAADATRTQASLAQPGVIAGTLAYMAPEQLRGQVADARSDVWAAGVTLYEMAAGALPFRGQTDFEISSEIIAQAPRPLPSNIQADLGSVIDRCLDKDPARRYQNGGELRAALEAIDARVPHRPRIPSLWLLAGTLAVAVTAIAANRYWSPLHRWLGGGRIDAIAVMPLRNLSEDPQQEYFADGMTESIITDLKRLTGLTRVIGHASMMRYKGSDKPLRQIANELDVDAILTGAVIRSGNRVVLTVQLIDPQTEDQIWTHRYQRDLTDVLLLQSQLTSEIAEAIRVTLAPEDANRLAAARRVSPEAYDAYLKGRFHWQKRTRQDLDSAEKYFELALSKEPDYALAHTGIGTVWGLRCSLGFVPCTVGLPKFKDSSLRALQLDPTLPEARAVVAATKFYVDWDWKGAATELPKAIAADPGYPEAHIWYAEFLANVAGRPDEAVAEVEKALESDPENTYYQAWVGEALLRARRYGDAIARFQGLLRSDPNLSIVRFDLQKAFEAKGDLVQAAAVWRQTLARGTDDEAAAIVERGLRQGGYRRALKLRGDLAVKRSETTYVSPSGIARWYAAAGDRELALDWLEKGFDEHETQMIKLRAWPEWDSLRDHPRFKALLRRLNLPG